MDTIWFTDPPYGILSDYEGYIGNKNMVAVMCFLLTKNQKL